MYKQTKLKVKSLFNFKAKERELIVLLFECYILILNILHYKIALILLIMNEKDSSKLKNIILTKKIKVEV